MNPENRAARQVDLSFNAEEAEPLRASAAGAAVLTLLALAAALATRAVYDHVLPSHSLPSLWAVAGALVIVLLLDSFLRLLKHRWSEASSEAYDARVSGQLFARLLGTRGTDMPRSALATSMFREFDAVREMRAARASGAWVDAASVALLLAAIALMSGPLALVPALGLLAVLAAWAAQARIERLSLAARDVQVERQALLSESVHGMEDVKLAGAEARLSDRMRALAERAAAEGAEIRRVAAVSSVAVGAVTTAVQSGVVVFGALLAMEGSISMGTMIAVSVLAGRVMAPCGQLAALAMRAGRARSALRTVEALQSGRPEREGGLSPDPSSVRGEVAFRGLTYHYPGREEPVLRGLDLVVAPGQVVALAGPRGGGKSTLGRLLSGLALADGERDTGTVSIDGIPVPQYSPDGLRSIVAACPQDCTLFSMSILDNIRLARPEATDEEVVRVATLAGAHEWVVRAPGGYGAMVLEGGRNMSGGERQSIGLARALLADTRVVFLDEPTAHFDPASTRRFVEGMKGWLRGRTALIATHKPELLALADRVALVVGGRVVRVVDPSEALSAMGPPPAGGGASR